LSCTPVSSLGNNRWIQAIVPPPARPADVPDETARGTFRFGAQAVPGQQHPAPPRFANSQDVGDHLVVVIVAAQALDRLDVAAECLITLAQKCHRLVGPAVFASRPLVPAGDHHKQRVEWVWAGVGQYSIA